MEEKKAINSNATKAELKSILEETEAQKKLAEERENELSEQVAKLSEENKKKEETFEDQMKSMQAMILQLQNAQIQTQQNKPSRRVEETIAIKSYLIGKTSISIDREGSYVTYGYTGAVEDVTITNTQSLINFGKNKQLFINGLLCFEDEENYNFFKIKPRTILTDEYIIDSFKKDDKEFAVEIKRITDNKKIPSVVHNFTHRAGLLYKEGKLTDVKYTTMEIFKNFFGYGLLELNVQFLEE